MSLFGQTAMYWRFALGLRKYLREPILLEQSQQMIKQRLVDRERNLIAIVKRAIYENQANPYLELLKLAGCEYGDFEKMVLSDGIEPTLKRLSEEGIYMSLEEFKGDKEVSRGGRDFQFKAGDFDNPLLSRDFEVRSGATRSAGTRTMYDFDYMTASWSLYLKFMFDVYENSSIPIAIWLPVMPGFGPIALLTYTKAGKRPNKWFSPVESKEIKPSLKNRMATNYIVNVGRILGMKWPSPEYICFDDAWIIAEWLADTIKQCGGCWMGTYTSAALRIGQASKERGLDIAGTIFLIGGEPTTPTKRKEIESTGARVCPTYGFTEAGLVGCGCANPKVADDVHLVKDSLALIQNTKEIPHAQVSVDTFLFTTLLPSAPKILLNVESGDFGVIETRNCGCKFERTGFADHIHSIRSYEKLTSEGMTFFGSDFTRLIEEVLPAKFGGTSLDYQMVEEEDDEGITRMSVFVSPELGVLDEDELIRIVLAELGRGKDMMRMMAKVWSQAKTIRIRRVRPIATARGKLLPLHIRKN
jgi:hypothetical protein